MKDASQLVSLRVRVIPRSAVNRVVGWADSLHDMLLVKVTAPAEGGKANEAVVKLLADELDIPKNAVTIRRGETSRNKLIALEIAPEKLQAWLEKL